MKIIGTPMKNFGFRSLCLKINIDKSIKGAPPKSAILNNLFSDTLDFDFPKLANSLS